VDGLPGWSIEKINSRWEARKVKNQVAVFSQKFNTKKEAFQFLQGVENVN
jgi:hypothetical protein